MKNKRILVTGATGFIGSRLVEKLDLFGYEIRCLVRKNSDISKLKKLKKIEIVYGDITQKESIKNIFKNIDVVIHLAALIDLSDFKFKEYSRINVLGLRNVVNLSLKNKVKRIIYTTTTAALGNIKKDVITEEDKGIPLNDYGISKLKAEKELDCLIKKKKAPIIVLRFCHVYGPGELRDLYFIIKMMKKGIFPQIGLSKNLYPAVYIDDAVQALMKAIDGGKFGEYYNIADKKSHDLKEIRKIINEEFNKKCLFYPFLPRYPVVFMFKLFEIIFEFLGINFRIKAKNILSITSARVFSIEKAKRDLGYWPETSLRTGLRNSINWYKREGFL